MMNYWGYWGRPYMMGGPGIWVGGVIGIILTVVFWVFVVLVFLSLIRGLKRHRYEDGYDGEKPGKALDILKERYAKGEINKKTFDEMKKDIS